MEAWDGPFQLAIGDHLVELMHVTRLDPQPGLSHVSGPYRNQLAACKLAV